jgi:hypothetical protein
LGPFMIGYCEYSFIHSFTFRRSLQIWNHSHSVYKSVQGSCHNTTDKSLYWYVRQIMKVIKY